MRKEISVSTIDEGSIDEIFAYIQEKIAEQSNQNMNDVSFSSSNVPEQIRQFAELRDQGIITEEEFAKKKEQLLDIN